MNKNWDWQQLIKQIQSLLLLTHHNSETHREVSERGKHFLYSCDQFQDKREKYFIKYFHTTIPYIIWNRNERTISHSNHSLRNECHTCLSLSFLFFLKFE